LKAHQAETIAECFAQNLKQIRKTKGLTQEGLAQACGLSLVFLQNLEAGRRWVSPATVTALSKALRVPETSFFKSCRDNAAATSDQPNEFPHLPHDVRELLAEISKHPEWPWDFVRLLLAGFESERSPYKRPLKKSFPGKPLKPLR
jgi:transcriptional regulator with XRE-family HTH domain